MLVTVIYSTDGGLADGFDGDFPCIIDGGHTGIAALEGNRQDIVIPQRRRLEILTPNHRNRWFRPAQSRLPLCNSQYKTLRRRSIVFIAVESSGDGRLTHFFHGDITFSINRCYAGVAALKGSW